MRISLCLRHLIQFKSLTQPQNRFNSQNLGSAVYPSNWLPVDLFLETPSPKASKIQTLTCLAFKTVRLELCPKPIQNPSQFFPKTELPEVGRWFPQSRWLTSSKFAPFSQSRWQISPKSAQTPRQSKTTIKKGQIHSWREDLFDGSCMFPSLVSVLFLSMCWDVFPHLPGEGC